MVGWVMFLKLWKSAKRRDIKENQKKLGGACGNTHVINANTPIK